MSPNRKGNSMRELRAQKPPWRGRVYKRAFVRSGKWWGPAPLLLLLHNLALTMEAALPDPAPGLGRSFVPRTTLRRDPAYGGEAGRGWLSPGSQA